jgi:hypothetical protein
MPAVIGVKSATVLMVLSLFGFAAVLLQVTAIAPIFGFNTRVIQAEDHELGFAYIVPSDNSLGSTLRDQGAYITEDGVRLGPANSLHDTIRDIGRGAFSFYNGALRFSSSDNSDPRSNGRLYREHVPRSPPLAIVILIFFGFAAASPALYQSTGQDRIRSICSRIGLDQSLLAFGVVTAGMMAASPWAILTRTSNDTTDWARLAIATALAVGFSFVRAASLPTGARFFLRFFAVLALVLCALRWYPEPASFDRPLNSWLIHGGRWLGVASAVLAWWRPSFLLLAVGSEMWARRASEFLTGFPQADVDEAPVVEMAIFFLLWCLIVASAKRFAPRIAGKSVRPFTVGLYGALGIHLANYFYSAVAKMRLDGPIGSWIVHNPTHALLSNAHELGAAPLGASPFLFEVVYRLMGHGIVGFNLMTWLSQALSLPAILVSAAVPWLLVVFDLWHLSVFATTGIFFFKWIVVNAAFVAALPWCEEQVPLGARSMAVVLCLAAPLSFHLFPAGWYDTFMLNRLRVFAVTDAGQVRVPPAFFGAYSHGVSMSTFWAPVVSQKLYPTATFGTTNSLAVSEASRSCPSVAGLSAGERAFRPGLESLVQSLHRAWLSRAGSDGHPHALLYGAYPYHIATNPLDFGAFWSLDLRRVRGYLFEIEPVCTVRASLYELPKTGPKSELMINVQ